MIHGKNNNTEGGAQARYVAWFGVVDQYQGSANVEQARFGMANFGTTKVCQIMPWYFKIRSHFLGVTVRALGMHISLCPRNVLYREIDCNHPEAFMNNTEPPRKSQQPSRSFQEMTASYQRPIGSNNQHSLSKLVEPQSGNSVPHSLVWHSVGTETSVHSPVPCGTP